MNTYADQVMDIDITKLDEQKCMNEGVKFHDLVLYDVKSQMSSKSSGWEQYPFMLEFNNDEATI